LNGLSPYLVIAAGAVLGANARYAVTNWTVSRWGTAFPYGTFVINVSGAFVIGIFLAFVAERAPINALWRLFFVTGFLGAYTTFSTYTWEVLTLGEGGAWIRAAVYVAGTNLLGLLGVWLGAAIARTLA
jgi:fluoride exporter